jgi:crotonobetainyl-CoA:carnitine CoA-transferase CaiB-like acyl-CoA transferase
MAGPLKGIRVLDLTRILAGPWCTQILGDLGAEVIKIEHPETGDDTRHWGPPWLKDSDGNETDQAAYFLSANRNKSSVTLNLKSEQGVEILRQLVSKCDVMVENFKVGGLAKLGLDYDSLKEVNPGLVYLSITGFGQTGPMASQPGYDYLIQGLGGLMSITGEADDLPGGGPQRVGVAIADINTGFYATIAILGALFHRKGTGQGQYIDLALLDSQVGWLVNQAMNYLVGGVVPERTGNWHPNLVPYQTFPASDGDVIIAVGNDRQFRIFTDFIGLASLADDVRYSTNAARIENRQQLIAMISEKTAGKPAAYWLENLPKSGVPCSGINNIKQVFEHPQVQARNMQIELPHDIAGSVPGVANPINYSQTPVEYRNAPPGHGQHTSEVLKDLLGYDSATITELKHAGVL